jgi:RNA polymerase sigma factor (sigma-70 family)
MTENLLRKALHGIRHAAGRSDAARHEDQLLLDRFVGRRDAAAFEVLVKRHGPMVFGVCRRLLGDVQEAEDACQATFLVLARKARSVAQGELLAGWLYGVAWRTALKARARRPRMLEARPPPDPPGGEPTADEAMRAEVRAVVDEEVQRLPARYRMPVILCYLQGETLTQAAQRMGCPPGTVSGRLARARDLLRARLTRRGLALSAPALAVLLAPESSPALPPALARTTAQAAALGAGTGPVLGISQSVVSLTEGTVKAMFLTKVKIAVLWLVAAGGAAGSLWAAYPAPDPEPRRDDPPAPAVVRPDAAPAARAKNKEDEPLTLSAVFLDDEKVQSLVKGARVSARLRTLLVERYKVACTETRCCGEQYLAGRGTLDILIGAAARLREAERDLNPSKETEIAAWKKHLQLLEEVEKVTQAQYKAGKKSLAEAAQAQYCRLTAEIGLERAKEK